MKKLIFVLTCLFLAIPCQAKIIYVDSDAPGPTHDGSSWANAYRDLQDALTDANSSVKSVDILVAQGIYKPDHGGGQTTGDRTATFHLINGVTLRGGYAGYGEPDPDARDIEAYETILSGDLDGNDVEVAEPCDLLTEPTRADNSYHVVTGSGTEPNAVLDGFTIRAGNANNVDPHNDGGGMYNDLASPTVVDCTFIRNSADRWGGGICCKGIGMFTINNCTFSENQASDGGGITCNDNSDAKITECVFQNNSVETDGGGMHCIGRSNLTIDKCILDNNKAGAGGGICCTVESRAVITGCIIKENSVTGPGGGIFCDAYGRVEIKNTLIVGNSSDWYGGGICCRLNGSAALTNCILWSDTPDELGGSASVLYSDVQGGWPGLGNIDADPCFVDPCNGDYHLKSQAGHWDRNSESWVLDEVTSPCIDAGNPGCLLDDEPAPNGNRRNMGAYGGTAEASKSLENWRSIADMTNDWLVDSNDLKVFVGYWLQTGECIPSDFDRSQFVDFDDFAILGLHWSYPSASEPSMTFQIDDCNMEDGLNWSVAVESNEPRFSVWVEGRYIYFEDMMYANCCPDELGLDKEINGNKIILYEIGYGGLCDCMCYFPITATLGPFEDGTYTVEVYDNYGKSLGVVEVTIGGATGPVMTYYIDDCNMEEGQSQTVAAESNEPRFSLWVEGRYIHFEDMMYANCCPEELGLDKEINGNQITLYEIGYGGLCFCMCYFPITATLGPFEYGTYTVEVFDNYGNSLGVVEVTIGGSPEPGITYQIEDCNRDASYVFAAEPPDKTRFTITVEDRYIHFEDLMVANCCPDELGLDMTVEESIITIYETEYTLEGCRCMCSFPITATLGPFEPGAYTLEVYEDHGGFIGSTTVVIDPPQ